MEIKPASRIEALPVYAFAAVDAKAGQLRAKGIEPIDFGIGDPAVPTPKLVREAAKRAIDDCQCSGYPSYIGSADFRAKVASWSNIRFGIDLDPATEVSSTIGSKEGIFNFHEGFVNPGDVVLIPSPGYPPYSRGTLFAEGEPYFYPLEAENGFLPDLDAIPADKVAAAKILWINYPNSPSGVCPGLDFYERVYEWTRKRGIILASDEAYSEYYFGDRPPPTALEVGREGVITFNSMSKRSAMTCYRVGWVAGDARVVAIFRRVKTNIDSGTPTFLQHAAMAAFDDEDHVAEMREDYRAKRDLMIAAFEKIGLPTRTPEGTLYIWQRVPEGMSSVTFAERLMEPDMGIVCTPGSAIAPRTAAGVNPGEGYVRFSLTPTIDDVKVAAEKIGSMKL